MKSLNTGQHRVWYQKIGSRLLQSPWPMENFMSAWKLAKDCNLSVKSNSSTFFSIFSLKCVIQIYCALIYTYLLFMPIHFLPLWVKLDQLLFKIECKSTCQKVLLISILKLESSSFLCIFTPKFKNLISFCITEWSTNTYEWNKLL